jgi:hypothetical protein
MLPDTPFTDIDAEPLLEAEDNVANEEFLLLELHQRVLLNNTKNVVKLVAKRSDPKIFTIS